MTFAVSRLLTSLVVLAVAAWLLVTSLSLGAFAADLYRFVNLDPDAYVTGRGLVVEVQGWGPWRTQVVERVNEPTRARVLPHPEGWQPGYSQFRLGAGVGHHMDAPPPDGVWLRFGAGALLALVAAALLVRSGVRHGRASVTKFGEVVFGQRSPDAEVVTWLPGGGTHGSTGGQVPPYVPYNPDWDHKHRPPSHR